MEKTAPAVQSAVHVRASIDNGGSTISSSFTLRDTFAMYALMSMPLHTDNVALHPESMDRITEKRAIIAYAQADAMLEERAKKLKYKRKGEA
jgi:hypothetical protein